MIYLDNASTTRINEEVLNAMMPYFNQFYFNASSNHKEGVLVKNEIEKSRELCAELIHADPSEIIFTSGATESINYAIKGFFEENFEKGNHLITCKTEHKAVLNTCEYLETKGIEVTYLDVDSNGLVGYVAAKDPLYDPVKAKKLIEQVKNEQQQPIEIPLSTNNTYLDIAEYLQREWEKLGIKVKIDVMPPSTLRQAIATNKVPFFRGSWIADYPDAENYLSLFNSANFTPNGPNYTHFKNDDFDALYQKTLQTVNEEERVKLYKQMDAIIAEEVPVIILFYDKVARFTQKNIQGLQPNAMNGLNLKYVKKN